MRAAWTLGVIAILATGCGGDDDQDDSGGGGGDAVSGCEAFADAWCDRAIGCLVELGTLTQADFDAQLDVCIDVGVAAARCENAVALGPTYDECLADIDAKLCTDWDVPMSELGTVLPPDTCRGQIMVRQ
jgi:hypothetical protein